MSNKDFISDEELEMLLRDRAKAKPGESCLDYDLLIYDYASKNTVARDEGLTPDSEKMIKQHLDTCRYCYYRYLDAVSVLKKPGTTERYHTLTTLLLDREKKDIRSLTKQYLFSKDKTVRKYAMKYIQEIEQNIKEAALQDTINRLQGEDNLRQKTLDFINKCLPTKDTALFRDVGNDVQYLSDHISYRAITLINPFLAPRLAAGTEDESPIETGIFEDESREFQFEFVLYEDKLLEVSIFRCDRPDLPKEIEIEITNIPNQSPLLCTLKRDEENQRYFCYIEDIPKEVLQTVSQKVPLKLKHLNDCHIIVKDK